MELGFVQLSTYLLFRHELRYCKCHLLVLIEDAKDL